MIVPRLFVLSRQSRGLGEDPSSSCKNPPKIGVHPLPLYCSGYRSLESKVEDWQIFNVTRQLTRTLIARRAMYRKPLFWQALDGVIPIDIRQLF